MFQEGKIQKYEEWINNYSILYNYLYYSFTIEELNYKKRVEKDRIIK